MREGGTNRRSSLVIRDSTTEDGRRRTKVGSQKTEDGRGTRDEILNTKS